MTDITDDTTPAPAVGDDGFQGARATGVHEGERLRRLADGARRGLTPSTPTAQASTCRARTARWMACLSALYDAPPPTAAQAAGAGPPNAPGGLGGSAPNVARWARRHPPATSHRVCGAGDCSATPIERLDLQRMLLEPEMLEAIEARHPPRLHLARPPAPACPTPPGRRRGLVVGKVVDDLQATSRDADPSKLSAVRWREPPAPRRPRPADIDWDRTVSRQPGPTTSPP